jgi:hypothetical protein
MLDLTADILGEGDLTPDVQQKALELMQAILRSPTTPGGVSAATTSTLAAAAPTAPAANLATGNRRLVYVHGICAHDSGYSNSWWAALQPFASTAFGAGILGDTRLEVLWSDVIATATAVALAAAPGPVSEKTRAATEIREAMWDRIDRHAMAAGPRTAAGAAPVALADARGLVAPPGLECVEDFTIYLVNDAVRQKVIDRFISVVQPLISVGLEVDVISHSWGTVVAYEALRQMEDAGVTQPRIRNLFTVGAALSIAPVKLRLRPANQDGRRPATVRRWVNLNANGDVVGGPLQDRPYQVDADYANLDPFGCASFLGIVNPVCAHSSYFQAGNVAVNRDIFGAYIDKP